MNREGIVQVLSYLHIESVTHHSEWVMGSCPFAPFKHDKRTDARPSFGVSVHDAAPSVFHCFTCKSTGPLTRLVVALSAHYTDGRYDELLATINAAEEYGYPLEEWGDDMRSPTREQLGEPLDPELLELFDRADNHCYLEDRSVTKEVSRLMGLRYDPQDSQKESRILFPVYTADCQWYGFTGRAVRDGAQPKVRDYFGLPKRLLLLGAHLVHRFTERPFILLTEGPFDCARGLSYGYATVAALHSGLTEAQSDILIRMNRPVVSFFDNDEAGRLGTKQAKARLGKHIPFLVPEWRHSVCFRSDSQRREVGAHDLDELTEDEVHGMVREAELY
jgi:DNA primase